MDTLGLLHSLKIQAACIQDRIGAKEVLLQAKKGLTRMQKIWADGGYTGELIAWTRQQCGWELTIVEKRLGQKTFQVLPKRWIVERSFAWLNSYRLLDKEHELLTETSEGNIYAACSHRMLRWLAP